MLLKKESIMTTAKRKQNIRRIHALLSKTDMMEHKRDIIEGSYGVDSTKKLSADQMEDMISWLEAKLQYGELKDHQWALFDISNQQHRKLLSLCQELGWTAWSDKYNRTVADLNRLGKWLQERSKIRKPLLHQTNKELHVTIYQFEEMTRKHFQ
jgi:hypothetical protein